MSELSPRYDFLQSHGLTTVAPRELNAALVQAVAELRSTLYGESADELTAGERAALEAGGVRFDVEPDGAPLTDSVVRYAALLESSLGTSDVAARLGVPESRVRQMIARRTLYSVLVDGRRRVLAYQFLPDAGLVPGIGRVNAALDTELHPLSVHEWFTKPDGELFVGDDIDTTLSPIAWLRSGGDVGKLVRLARDY